MQSFKSIHYPTRKSRFAVLQDNAMPFYAGFILLVMVGTVLRSQSGKEIPIFTAVGIAIAIVLGNFFAQVKMRRNIAEIFFTGETFSLVSIYDIAYKQPTAAFPLRFANAHRVGDHIELHYTDLVLMLKREDWGEEFDLIWNWLSEPREDTPTSFTSTSSW
jgi:hypothetical protein